MPLWTSNNWEYTMDLCGKRLHRVRISVRVFLQTVGLSKFSEIAWADECATEIATEASLALYSQGNYAATLKFAIGHLLLTPAAICCQHLA